MNCPVLHALILTFCSALRLLCDFAVCLCWIASCRLHRKSAPRGAPAISQPQQRRDSEGEEKPEWEDPKPVGAPAPRERIDDVSHLELTEPDVDAVRGAARHHEGGSRRVALVSPSPRN